MEMRHLRDFVALAQELGFTRAARRTHLTQSTLSHRIRQLEDEVQQRLFERAGRRVRLTQAGRCGFRTSAQGFGLMSPAAPAEPRRHG